MEFDVNSVTGVLRNGRVELSPPVSWGDGSMVVVTLAPAGDNAATDGTAPPRMMREEDWPTTPEGIAEHLKRMQEFEPVELTPEDEARIAAWRAEMKRFNIEAMARKMGLKP
jgi:hypothetical protein